MNTQKGSLMTLKPLMILMDLRTRFTILILIITSIINAGLSALFPVYLSKICTHIAILSSNAPIYILQFATLFLVSEILSQVRRVAADCMISRQERILRVVGIKKMLRLPISFYGQSMSGELATRVNQAISGFSQMLKLFSNDVVPAVLTCIMVLMEVLKSAPPLFAIIMIFYLLISIIISHFQIRSQNGIRQLIINKKAVLDGRFCQSIQNIELIRGMNADCYELKLLTPFALQIQETECRHHMFMGGFDTVKKITQIICFSALMSLCLVYTRQNYMSGNMTLTIALFFMQLIVPSESVYRCLDELVCCQIKAKTLAEIFNHEEDKHFMNSKKSITVNNCILTVSECTIQDPVSNQTISSPPDFLLMQSDIAILHGLTGSGKTSVLRAIKGLYPYSGNMHLYSNSIKDLSSESLANTIYYVPHGTLYFKGTIRDNLAYGLSDHVPDIKMKEALIKAHLFAELELIGNPLDHPIQENAQNLSAGQRQRLSLARVFLHHFRLLILDEATANLDVQTAQLILTEIENWTKQQQGAILYISHDNEVMKRCQKVIEISAKTINKQQSVFDYTPLITHHQSHLEVLT